MDPVDVLTFAATTAQYLRSTGDPELALARAFGYLEEPAPDRDEPFPVRVARLADAAGERRQELMDHLREHAGPLPMNRPLADPDAPLDEPDPEVERLIDYASEHEDEGVSLFGDRAFGAYVIASRTAAGYFHGRTVVVRNGKRLTEEKAGKPRPGDEVVEEELPAAVRCVLDYPLEVPVVFTIETGTGSWDLWQICTAIADEYARVYEAAGRHGVWGHDLSDLVIEDLLYFPGEKLIYPHIGS